MKANPECIGMPQNTAPQPVHEQLTLGVRRPSLWQRLSGWGLDTAGKVGRVLEFHSMANAAELEGRCRRADFFWHEAHIQLHRLFKQLEPSLLTLVEEVFLRTHCAFVSRASGTRAYLHLDYIRQIIDYTTLSLGQKRELLGPATLRQIAVCKASKQWERAEELAADLIQRFPEIEEYQEQLGEVYFTQTIANLSHEQSPSKSRRDADTLRKGISKLVRMRDDYPHNLTLMELLGQLHHWCAVKLEHGGRLAEALAEVQIALTFHPQLGAADETRQRLEHIMQSLRIRLAMAATEPSPHSKQSRRKHAKRMQQEVAKGFRLIDEFKRSDEARLITEDRLVAQGRRLWQEIGLGPLERVDLRPLALYSGIQLIQQSPPVTPEEVASVWHRVATQNRDLADLDAHSVVCYLTAQFCGVEEKPTEPSAIAAEDNAGCVPASRRRFDSEPFFYWLLSSQGHRVKIQCAVAIVLVALAIGLTMREGARRTARDMAYNQLRETRGTRDYPRMMQEAEAFLSHTGLGKDGRATEVKALYSEALVRWFTEESPELEQADVYVQRYRSLMLDPTSRGSQE